MKVRDGLNVERLRVDGERLLEDLSREIYQAQAGLSPTAELQPIYARHADILGGDAISMVRERFVAAAEGSEERRSARMLLDWLADTHAQRALATLDEREIAWEGSAMIAVSDGRSIPYQRAAIEMANAERREDRLAIERGRSALVARELAPLRRDRFAREKELAESLDVAADYPSAFTALTGIDVNALAEECRTFLRDTQAMWDDTASEVVRTRLGIRMDEATRADALALLRGRDFDEFFASSKLEPAVRSHVAEMGIDAEAGGRIIFDTGEREGKRSRAFCAPVRVPGEVYLVLRPHGGQSDYRTLLHELGHALHFGYIRPDLPFEYRWLGDNSVTEAYAMLFDHLLHDGGWLLRYTALGKKDVPAFRRAAGFEELHFLRRYCAKIQYELELYGNGTPLNSLPDLYVTTLTGATTFRYDPADAFVDVDPRFYSARYLRAWQLQALISEALVERFDADWYRNPRAGPWMVVELFGEGQRELGQELAARVVGKGMSFKEVLRGVEVLLEG
ncbi:MAG: hypothetical protein ACR2G6_09965 [Gemmatimonadaceae bacterium]